MPNLTYTVADFQSFTTIVSADVNSRFDDIKTLLNTTGLDDTNLQNAGITRATKLKLGTASYVVINDGTGAMSEEAQLSTTRGGLGFAPTVSAANAGKAVVVNDAGSSLALGTPSVDRITQSLASDIADITAGEAISAGEAVCLALGQDSSGDSIYRVFKTDSDSVTRKNNFIGFATAAATVTAHTLTWTNDAALVTGNSITWDVNDRQYTQAFDTDNDTTLAAIAVQLAADDEIQSAAVVDAGSNDRVINITGKGGLQININNATVTGGASQANIAIATTQSPAGDAVNIRTFGLLTGLSGLTTGSFYYVSSTAGAITATPTDTSPVQVGQALDPTALFVNRNVGAYTFPSSDNLVHSHGSTAASTTGSAVASVELFNYSTWSTGTADSTATSRCGGGSSAFQGYHYVVDGLDTAGSSQGMSHIYNKASWSTGTARSAGNLGANFGIAALSNSVLVVLNGSTGATYTTATTGVDTYNGTSWTTSVATTGEQKISSASFYYSSNVFSTGGVTSAGSSTTSNYSFNGSSVGTETALPTAALGGAGAVSPSGGGAGTYRAEANGLGYVWSGSWSSSISLGAIVHGVSPLQVGPGAGYSTGTNTLFLNGGSSASTTSINTTYRFNGTSYSSSTSSTISRAGGAGSVI